MSLKNKAPDDRTKIITKEESMSEQAEGKIVQIIGAVIDVEFAPDGMPRVYDALAVPDGGGLVLEVQQQLETVLFALSHWARQKGSSAAFRRLIPEAPSAFRWDKKHWGALWMCWQSDR